MEEITNRVTNSQLITFDLEEYYTPGERVVFDIKNFLFQGIILKEKDFRDAIRNHDWSQYSEKHVAIICSADAIIPTWAFMLLSIALQPYAKRVVFGNLSELESQLFYNALSQIDWEKFRDKKMIIRGCSKVEVPLSAYVEVTNRLRSVANSIMFGEPCSTVPLFKKKLP